MRCVDPVGLGKIRFSVSKRARRAEKRVDRPCSFEIRRENAGPKERFRKEPKNQWRRYKFLKKGR